MLSKLLQLSDCVNEPFSSHLEIVNESSRRELNQVTCLEWLTVQFWTLRTGHDISTLPTLIHPLSYTCGNLEAALVAPIKHD